ncbi:hypothetical protein H9P43_007814 [Blastocladiella emersonii ATCC 22665]|nr:hypothetical protein H9P43_007814 [Blastocladiella emersonii ATCC 22665]
MYVHGPVINDYDDRHHVNAKLPIFDDDLPLPATAADTGLITIKAKITNHAKSVEWFLIFIFNELDSVQCGYVIALHYADGSQEKQSKRVQRIAERKQERAARNEQQNTAELVIVEPAQQLVVNPANADPKQQPVALGAADPVDSGAPVHAEAGTTLSGTLAVSSLPFASDVERLASHAGFSVHAAAKASEGTSQNGARLNRSAQPATSGTHHYSVLYSVHSTVRPTLVRVDPASPFDDDKAWNVFESGEDAMLMIRHPVGTTGEPEYHTGRPVIVCALLPKDLDNEYCHNRFVPLRRTATRRLQALGQPVPSVPKTRRPRKAPACTLCKVTGHNTQTCKLPRGSPTRPAALDHDDATGTERGRGRACGSRRGCGRGHGVEFELR